MGIETLYADSIEEGIQRQLKNPGAAPEPSFSLWSAIGAGATGPIAGALESAGSMADVLSGFGTASAASGGSAGGMFSLPSADEQKQQEEARQRMLKSDSFDTAAGNELRRKATAWGPDPYTAHTADQVIHGLTRFAAKAIADVGTMGPIAGGTALALDEGNTVTQRLRMDGVDTATAVKVGAVQGGLAGLSAVVPMAGKTLAETIGLIAAGGPGSFMAQEHFTRRILEEAGRNDIASLHDPFDPLGLSLATIIPGAFGAVHARGIAQRGAAVEAGTVPLQSLTPKEVRAVKYNDPRLDDYAEKAATRNGVPPEVLLGVKNAGEKSNPTATSPAGAKGVMQFMEGTAKEMGLVDRTDPLASIDAGAAYLKKLYDAYGSWDAAVAHYNGGGTQAVLVRGGGKPSFPETAAYLERVKAYAAERSGEKTVQRAAADQGIVDAARVKVQQDTVAKSLPETPEAYGEMTRAQDVVSEAGGRVAEESITPMLRPQAEMVHAALRDVAAKLDLGMYEPALWGEGVKAPDGYSLSMLSNGDLPRYFRDEKTVQLPKASPEEYAALFGSTREDVLAHELGHAMAEKFGVTGSFAGEAYKDLRAEMRGISKEFRPDVWEKFSKHAGKHQELLADNLAMWLTRPEMRERMPELTKFMGERLEPFKPLTDHLMPRAADNALPAADSVTIKPPAPVKTASRVTKAGAETPSLDTQVAQRIVKENADMQVILPGSEERITVATAMERIKEEQKQETQFADLLKVAVECALSAG